MNVTDAARHFGVSVRTLRRWIADGCPCVELGKVGRGHGTRLDVAAVARWRTQQSPSPPADETMLKVEEGIYDAIRRDGGNGISIVQQLGIPIEAAAELLTHVRNRIARSLGLK